MSHVRQRSSTTNESAAEQDRKCEMDRGAKQQKDLETHQIGPRFDLKKQKMKLWSWLCFGHFFLLQQHVFVNSSLVV